MGLHLNTPKHIACMSLAILACASPAGQCKRPTKSDIATAWRARQDHAKTARFCWTDRKTYIAGCLSNTLSGFPGRHASVEGKVIPPADSTLSIPMTFSVDGEKLRIDYVDWQWSFRNNCYESQPTSAAFNGRVAKVFFRRGAAHRPSYHGCIPATDDVTQLTTPTLWPFLITFRGMTPSLARYRFDELAVIDQSSLIGDHECIELRLIGNGETLSRLWADPQRDFVIVRCFLMDHNRLVQQFDIDYDCTPGGVWSPVRFMHLEFDSSERLLFSTQSTVTETSFNPSIPDKEFDIVFPPQTVFQDQRNGRNYFVRSDGSYKEFSQSDFGKSIDTLATEESTMLGAAARWTLVILATFALLLSWRYRRRRGSLRLG